MLNTDPAYLMQEIELAEKVRSRFLTNTTDLVRRFVGNWYRSDSRTRNRPENMLYAFVATMLPNLIFDNPAVTVSAKRSITHKDIARFMAMGINAWIKEINLRDDLEALALDMLFGYGVAKVGLEERPDGDGLGVEGRFSVDALRPYMIRLAPANFVIDPRCENVDSARFLGHRFQRDLADLRGDERYDQEIVEKLTADDEQREGTSARERAFKDQDGQGALRGRVTLYELFLPEHRQIGTIALNATGNGEWIRPLRPYHGPRRGPFVVFGVYMVPNQVYPLSPLAAVAEQDSELNAHAAAAAKEAATAKNITLVSADHPEVADKIETSATNSVVTVKGLNANMVIPVAVGGTSEQRLAYLDRLLVRTDRIAGQSEATRGRAQGVTATEAQLADANADARVEFVHLKYRDAVKEGLGRIGWFFYHDPAVVAPVSDEDPTTGEPFEGLFLGGVQPGQEDTDWTLFNLDIEPMSMRRVDSAEQQRRAEYCVQMAITVGPMIVQMPWINWQAILDLIGEAHNIPDFARMVLNQAGLQAIGYGLPYAMMGPGGPGGMMPLPGAGAGVQMAQAGVPLAQIPRLPMGGMGGGGGMPGRPAAMNAGIKPSGPRPISPAAFAAAKG